MGSHSDTQPEGGWLDGAYGRHRRAGGSARSAGGGGPPVSVVSFQDEEGRFGALTGSAVWSGKLSLDDADTAWRPMARASPTARARSPTAPTDFVDHDRFSAFLETHIEQGPVLDAPARPWASSPASWAAAVQRHVTGSRTMPAPRRWRSGRRLRGGGAGLGHAAGAVRQYRHTAKRLDHRAYPVASQCVVHRAGAGGVHAAMAGHRRGPAGPDGGRDQRASG
jgi:hypothetical protein